MSLFKTLFKRKSVAKKASKPAVRKTGGSKRVKRVSKKVSKRKSSSVKIKSIKKHGFSYVFK